MAAALAAIAACAPAEVAVEPLPTPPKLTLRQTSFIDLPDWRGDKHSAALHALLRSCRHLRPQSASRSLGESGIGGTVADWRPICAAAAAAATDGSDDGAARHFFEAWFIPYLAADNHQTEGLITGYFEPELKGSWTRKGSYQTPIYARPADLIEANLSRFRSQWRGYRLSGRLAAGHFVPYATRAEIESGALNGRGLELLWVNDWLDAFFLHIQGSGRVVMEDGRVVRLGFAGRNGHVYKSIGRELIARGAIAKNDVSMQTIRAWIMAHPAEGGLVMKRNPSFIFFRILDGGVGPVGAQGVVLTPGRSFAVDPRFVPFSLPIWLDTTDPLDPGKPLRRLVVAQDGGAAIKGPVRGDLFWGFGALAAARAGSMKQSGRYYLLLPKNTAPAQVNTKS